ncbi:glycosyltransferase, partial [Streptomyces caeruleatus]
MIDLLFVGRIAPNKGIEFLIDVVTYLNKSCRETYKLHIVGSRFNKSYFDKLYLQIFRSSSGHFIEFHGRIEEQQLRDL